MGRKVKVGFDPDNTPLGFGKYLDKTPDEISEFDPSYVVWLREEKGSSICSESLYIYCKRRLEEETKFRGGELNFN